jgi:hypothetical protein
METEHREKKTGDQTSFLTSTGPSQEFHPQFWTFHTCTFCLSVTYLAVPSNFKFDGTFECEVGFRVKIPNLWF